MRKLLFYMKVGDGRVKIDFGDYFWKEPPNWGEVTDRAIAMFRAGGYTGKVYSYNERESDDIVGEIE